MKRVTPSSDIIEKKYIIFLYIFLVYYASNHKKEVWEKEKKN